MAKVQYFNKIFQYSGSRCFHEQQRFLYHKLLPDVVVVVVKVYFLALYVTEIYIRTTKAPWTSSVLEVTEGICRNGGLEGVVGLGGERERWDSSRR